MKNLGSDKRYSLKRYYDENTKRFSVQISDESFLS